MINFRGDFLDVDRFTKAANQNSKKAFLLIKDSELEITMTFSWG